MTGLPLGWSQAKVRDVGFVQLGRQRSPDVHSGANMRPYLRVANVYEDRIDLSDVMQMHFEANEVARYELHAGDILLNEGQSRELVGRPAMYRGELPGACFTNSLVRFQPSEAICGTFALHLFRHWLRNGRFQSIAQVTTNIAHLGAGRFSDLELGLPPAAEQRRIVAKLEELTARSRRAKEALDAVPPLLDRLRQSILAAAFRGDLTADWRAQNPNVEPADKLIARIRAERRARWEAATLSRFTAQGKQAVGDKWKQKYRDPEQVDDSEFDLPELPSSWQWVTLGQLAWSVKDGPHFSPKYSENGIPFISGGNVRPDGIDFATAKVISPELHAELSMRCVPELDDLLYTKGGTTGIARVNTYTHAFNVWVHVAVLKLVPSVAPFFLQHMLNSPFCYAQAQRFTHGVGNQDLGLTRMVRIVLPLAPKGEQEEVVRRVDDAMSVAARMLGAIDEARDASKRLNQSILAKAFRGELVPQDPNDEPASVLLERIRAARANGETASGSRHRPRKAKAAANPPTDEDGPAGDGHRAPPAPPIASAPAPRATKDLNDLTAEEVLDQVFAALWTRGPLDKDDAVRLVAEHLRGAGYVEFQRLRSDGPLFAQVLGFLEAGVKAGRLDRPKRGQVRACKAEASAFTADDWRLALAASLGTEPVDRDEAIRAAAEWARDQLGLAFSRLRSDGPIALGLRSAINSAIRRGEVTRHDATRISRAVSEAQQPLPGILTAKAAGDRGQGRSPEGHEV